MGKKIKATKPTLHTLLIPIKPCLSIPANKVLAYNGREWLVGNLDWMEDDGGKVVGVCCVNRQLVDGVGIVDLTLKNVTQYIIV